MPNSMFPAMNVEPIQPWGGAGANPFSMLNDLAEFQNRQNMNTMFKLKLQANQAIGEIMANAPSLDAGIQAASRNPQAMAWGADAMNNIKSMQLLNAQVAGETQKQYQSALEFALKGMIPAGLQDWRQAGTAASAALSGASPLVKGTAADAIKRIQMGLTDGLQDVVKNDPQGPEHGMITAQNMYKARAVGYAGMGALRPEDIAQFLPSVENTGGQYVQMGPRAGSVGPQGQFIPGNAPQPMPGGPLYRTQAPGFAQQGEVPVGGANIGQNPYAQQWGGVHPEGQTAPWVYSNGEQNQIAADGKPLISNTPGMHFQGEPNFVGGMSPATRIQNDEYGKLFAVEGANANAAAMQAEGQAEELGRMYDYFAKKTVENGGKAPMIEPGPFAEYRKNLGAIENLTGQIFGASKMPNDPSALAAIEAGQKAQAALSASAAKSQMGQQRITNFELQTAGLSVPGIENTILGGKILSDLTAAQAAYTQDKFHFMQDYANHNNGYVLGAESEFANQHQPKDLINGILNKYGITPDGDFRSVDDVRKLRNEGYLTPDDAAEIVRRHPQWKPGAQGQ